MACRRCSADAASDHRLQCTAGLLCPRGSHDRTARLNGLPWRFTDASKRIDGSKGDEMPKLKTKSGVKKRFKITASGKVKHGVAGKRHRLISHNAKYIRQNRGTTVLDKADTPTIKLWAPYGLK
jgi:large subunit ribosomal protein L35